MAPSSFTIRRGMNIRMSGAPAGEVADEPASPTVCVQPREFEGFKFRLLVKEGDAVRRGAPVCFDKRNEAFQLAAPAGGVVRQIEYGPRRALERITIEVAAREEVEPYPRHAPSQIEGLARETVLRILQNSGFLALFRQRPFCRIPSPEARPKAIFVNGMATAPFLPDIHAAVRGDEASFQAGLDVLRRLTDGEVHLCLAPPAAGASPAVAGAERVRIHHFAGPHPAGNSSVHIHHIDPIRPGRTVWTIRATDVILVGRLFLTGEMPPSRVISLGGSGVREGEAGHYRVRIGGEIAPLLKGRMADGEIRVISGDALSGERVVRDGHLRLCADAVTLVPEDRERYLLGWMAPGFSAFSHSRLFPSTWLRKSGVWKLGTNRHGCLRPMVATGLYDQYLPMKIMADFLIRAVLAHDVEEAVKLGLLEVAPEDFALPAFVCPSKMDLVGIIRQGLAEAEAEGM